MWILLIILLIFIIVIAGTIDEKRTYKKEVEPFEKKNNAMASIRCSHLYGLSLAESKECIISFCSDKIIIESNGSAYNLDIHKIIDMNIKTSKEIQNSISNAAAGNILFGPLGVMLLGSTTQINRIFTIIYEDKDRNDKLISFDLGNNLDNFKYTNNYINAFDGQIRRSKEIEL